MSALYHGGIAMPDFPILLRLKTNRFGAHFLIRCNTTTSYPPTISHTSSYSHVHVKCDDYGRVV